MTQNFTTESIAEFTLDPATERLTAEHRQLLKRNVLDSLACAISGLGGPPFARLREYMAGFRSADGATLIGGGRTSVDQAAFYNSALIRYVDQLDTHLAEGGLCHPADNLGGILAVAEQVGAGGEAFLLALAVAYELQCRFTDAVPVMAKGFNHAIQLAISVAAGAGRLLELDREQLANAVAIATADNVSLALIHAEPVSQWKGFSPGMTAMRAIYATGLAARGFTGPLGLFEGPSGLERMFDQKISLDLDDRTLGAVERTVLKRYCSLIHGQPVIEATLTLKRANEIDAADIEHVTCEVFGPAFDFAGGGAMGPKGEPRTKEQADYNLRYLIAVGLLDDEVGPAQLDPQRIQASDVQSLLDRVDVQPDERLTKYYPQEIHATVAITLRNGRRLVQRQVDYEGGLSRPLTWPRVVEKFNWLTEPYADRALRETIVEIVSNLEARPVAELVEALSQAKQSASYPSEGTWARRFGHINSARAAA